MIELKNVKKYYGMKSIGLYNESIVINDGEIVGILGKNGSGKTTMLKAIMGLCELQAGEILIDGKPVSGQYEKMSFITEEGSFFPGMTPYEYGCFLADFVPAFNMERYCNLLKFFEIEIHAKIRTFSGRPEIKA